LCSVHPGGRGAFAGGGGLGGRDAMGKLVAADGKFKSGW
jgi:hypothetical protein